MSDLRSPLAKARDEFFESVEGKRLLGPGAEGVYLLNRLKVAYLAGHEEGRQSVALDEPLQAKHAKALEALKMAKETMTVWAAADFCANESDPGICKFESCIACRTRGALAAITGVLDG